MTKRPPEMIDLLDPPEGWVADWTGDWVDRDMAEAAIRSLKVKRCRDRATLHHYKSWVAQLFADRETNSERRDTYTLKSLFHSNAKRRFSRIADAIERGER